MLERLVSRLFRRAESIEMDPAAGYDLWSSTYDSEQGNLVVDLDENVFGRLLGRAALAGKTVIDVGCGTGRHWEKILGRGPATLVGYDVSAGMLARLKTKYPHATVHRASAECLSDAQGASCDVIVSTLAVSHVESIEAALAEWARVLRAGGDVLLTDFHPAAAATGDTSFRHGRRRMKIKIQVRPLEALKTAAVRAGFEVLALDETVVDASMRHYFERAGMRGAFEKIEGIPILYGLHLRKTGSSSR
jgi:ubiquinone/menaquinone biosynthesis C-methylase UbiE